MRQQPPGKRTGNFSEVPLGYNEEEAVCESARCLQCKTKPCIKGCPVSIDIPSFIYAINKRDFKLAINIIHENNALPAVTGRVCPQEEQCQVFCLAGKTGDPVSIGHLERFVSDLDLKRKGENRRDAKKSGRHVKGKKVAVIGSGPAGLSCAADLARMGYKTVVFEGYHKPGGVLVYGIPEFRLPKQIVSSEIELLKELGVTFMTNVLVGRALTLEDLFSDGFNAVFIGTGAGLPKFMNIPGENLNGIYSANEFLTRVNLMKAYIQGEFDTPVKRGENVAVIGGGNVAVDAARTALRLKAGNVYIVYRRGIDEMPARIDEIRHAQEEGIIFLTLTNPLSYEGDENGFVKSMKCIKMELGENDSSGRRSPVPVINSEFSIDIDEVIVAVGSASNPIIARTTKQLVFNNKGDIVADGMGRTSIKGVFAGGDIVTGSATVVTAMGAGRTAARSIKEYLETDKWDV